MNTQHLSPGISIRNTIKANASLKETVQHGTNSFPIEYYDGHYPDEQFINYLHWHEEVELMYFIEGKATLQIDLNTYIVEAGDLVITPPNVLHSISSIHTYPTQTETVVLNLRLLKGDGDDIVTSKFVNPFERGELVLPVHIRYEILSGTNLAEKYNQLTTALKNKPLGYELDVKATLYAIFAELLQKKDYLATGIQNYTSTKAISTLKKVIEYINSELNHKITVQSLATLAGYSEYHFLRFFKQHTGVTVGHYIMSLRIESAMSLLLHTDLSITDIAMDCGFESDSYFIKCFKKIVLETPHQYRKKRSTLFKKR